MKKPYNGVNRDGVGRGLEQAAILIGRYMSDRSALSLTASSVLDALQRRGPIWVPTLAATTGTGQPSMTELVQRLNRQGQVIRVDDPGDGRAALVTVTNAGRALLDDSRRYRRDP
jgi:DNA-binding MarR family transcriptional regulator